MNSASGDAQRRKNHIVDGRPQRAAKLRSRNAVPGAVE